VKKNRFWAVAPIVLLVALFIVPTSAFAHERRTVANGKYDVTVGWDVEPAYEDLKNAASIRIAEAGSNPAVPVAGAEKTLKVQIRQGANTKEFPLRSVFGQPGYYVADIVPTRDGDYQFTFVGSINDDQVNERFDSADGKFNGVQGLNALQFPTTLPDPAVVSVSAAAAQSEAQNARVLAYIGIGIGVIGLLVAIGAWMTRPRVAGATRQTAPAPASTTSHEHA
jgi:hypothetical protein